MGYRRDTGVEEVIEAANAACMNGCRRASIPHSAKAEDCVGREAASAPGCAYARPDMRFGNSG